MRYPKKNLEGEINSQAFEDLKNKFLDGDLTQNVYLYLEKNTIFR